MSCERYADAILERALGEPAAPDLEAHLTGCVACRAALDRELRLLRRIDGELREAVSLMPSPEFLPRVREGVANEARASAWTLRWLLPVAAGLLLLIATVPLLRQPAPTRSPVVAESPRPIPEARASVPEPPTRPLVRKPRPARPNTEPEVLVPPGEEELVRRFVVALRARRPDETAIVAGETQPDLAIPLLEEIAPLEMKPLTSGTDPKESIDD